LIIVTPARALAGVPVTAPTVQTLVVPVICGIVVALVVAVTVKAVLYAALAGAPVKVTVGAFFVAVVVWLRVAAE
jgi:hypothetical protein